MKTIRQHLETLQEPYRTKALDQIKYNILKEKEETLKDALLGAFYWSDTKEGHKYWDDLYKSLN